MCIILWLLVGTLIPSKTLNHNKQYVRNNKVYKSCVNLLTLKNQSHMESGCGWNVVLCELLQAAAFCRSVDDEDDAAAAAAATTLAQPFGHCFSGSSSRLADVLRLDTIRRSKTRSVDDIACVRAWYNNNILSTRCKCYYNNFATWRSRFTVLLRTSRARLPLL